MVVVGGNNVALQKNKNVKFYVVVLKKRGQNVSNV